MEMDSLGIGMNSAVYDTIWEIARIPALNAKILTLIEGVLLLVSSRDGHVSIQTVLNETEGCILDDCILSEHVESVFYALSQIGVLKRKSRDQRGVNFDPYCVFPDLLHQRIHDVCMAKSILARVKRANQESGHIELIATLPDNFLVDSQTPPAISSLSSALHRLVTEAGQEILILNPYFEQIGFDRLSSALLAAAKRGVSITVVTYQLSNPTSLNYRVLREIAEQARTRDLIEQFDFRDYQHNIGNRVLPVAHAKIVFIDEAKGYIGSANLTEYGMACNLEVGVILDGPETEKLKQIFEGILASEQAKSVTF